MADIQRNRPQLVLLFPDNSGGEISAQDVRDFVASVYTKDELDVLLAGHDFGHLHVQSVPATTWTIDHNMGGYPPIQIMDDEGCEIWGGSPQWVSDTQIQVAFTEAMTGRAIIGQAARP